MMQGAEQGDGSGRIDASVKAAYLEFGRLLGEKPSMVERKLEERGLEFDNDDTDASQNMDQCPPPPPPRPLAPPRHVMTDDLFALRVNATHRISKGCCMHAHSR